MARDLAAHRAELRQHARWHAEQLGHALARDVVRGRSEPARAHDELVCVTEPAQGRDDLPAIVGDGRELPHIEPVIGEGLGQPRRVRVHDLAARELGTDGQDRDGHRRAA
jgi:hypothetical protein